MTIDLTKCFTDYTKYDRCAYFLVNDKVPLRTLRNRLQALQAIADKVKPNSTFTSSELDVQPMALARLYANKRDSFWESMCPIQLVDEKECFIPVYDKFYIKAYYNVYALNWSIQEIKDFVNAVCKAFGIVLYVSGT